MPAMLNGELFVGIEERLGFTSIWLFKNSDIVFFKFITKSVKK